MTAIVDLRSDTVTMPCADMRAAMSAADVGDDVYGEDPTVNALEERAAELLGKQAARFFPSGTQSNLAALLSHCGRGDEFLVGQGYHVYRYEAGGGAVLGGATPFPLPVAEDGSIAAADVTAAVKPDDPHYPVTRMLSLENTHSGKAVPLAKIEAPAQAARAAGLSVHLDGARLFNAAAALGVPASAIAAHADTVSICLSKGLGAPVGTVLCGSVDLLARAYRMRKILGGGMRQAGVIASAGLFALNNNIERLADDHARAAKLAAALADMGIYALDPAPEKTNQSTPTNMVFMSPPDGAGEALAAHMRALGVEIGSHYDAFRLVLHKDIDDAGLARAIDGFAGFARDHAGNRTAAQ